MGTHKRVTSENRAAIVSGWVWFAGVMLFVAGRSVRQGPADITVFKSVGVAWQDLIIAAAVGE